MKIKEFQKRLKERGVDAAVLYNMETNYANANMKYLADYSGYGFLIISADKKPFLLAPLLDAEYAWKSSVKFHIMKKDFMEKVKKKLGNAKKLGVESRKFSISAQKKFRKYFKKAQFLDITDILEELRMAKTAKEIKLIKQASVITNKIMNSCLRSFKNFRTERDVYNFLRTECIKNSVEPSFDFVVAAGRSPATPHHIPKNKKLVRGFCVIDFGIRYKGYCTDITRTVFIGRPSKKQKEIYNKVLGVQENAIKNIEVGKKFSEVASQAREEFGSYNKRFVHALGHGLGVEVHEKPAVSYLSKTEIKDGMYFTIEPGVYFPLRFGIRIEDDILVEKNKAVNLTKVPKNLLSVKPKAFK